MAVVPLEAATKGRLGYSGATTSLMLGVNGLLNNIVTLAGDATDWIIRYRRRRRT